MTDIGCDTDGWRPADDAAADKFRHDVAATMLVRTHNMDLNAHKTE
jgi:hypothetical protein